MCHGQTINYAQHHRFSQTCTVIISTFFILFIVVITWGAKYLLSKKRKADPFGSLSVVEYIANLFIFTTLCALILGLSVRLKLLNQILNQNFTKDFQNFEVLKFFGNNFVNLKKIVVTLNELFAVPLAIFFGTNLFLIAFLFYDYYALFAVQDENNSQFFYAISTTFMRAYMLILVIAITCCCMELKKQENEALNILHKFSIIKMKRKSKIKIENLAEQIELSSLSFSCGMFKFDWEIIFGVSIGE